MNAPADQRRFLERLLGVEAALLAGRPVDADAVLEVVAIVRSYRTGCDVDEILGFDAPVPGERTPLTKAAQGERNWYLKRLAVEFYPVTSDAAAARSICAGWLQYERSPAAKTDTNEPICPRRHEGRPNELFWYLHRLGEPPLSDRSIRAILAGS